MNRLSSELQRLYLPPSAEDLIGPDGAVRALVLELTQPASWEALAAVWRGVQTDLELPAPAIAVSGTDGLQLWFSLAAAVPPAEGRVFLDALRQRYLAEVAATRVRLWPAVDGAAPRHAPRVPAEQGHSGNWSAFVAPDLAPVFADTPWLDTPPNPEGQADLLSHLASISAPAWAAACGRLKPAVPVRESKRNDAAGPASSGLDPKRFLLQVMGDETVELALRIEAAKALLPYTEGR
ncbi:MAG TPA: hypothetical protein VFL64_19390 [Rhizobacter sp.]|nr:hypothetical protein [Rhizobacter sp.]